MTLYSITQQHLPIDDQNPYRIPNFVLEGGRPKFNEAISIKSSLKQLIEDCWKQNPSDRPTFDEICKRFLQGIISMESIDENKVKQYITFIQSSPYYSPLPSSQNDNNHDGSKIYEIGDKYFNKQDY